LLKSDIAGYPCRAARCATCTTSAIVSSSSPRIAISAFDWVLPTAIPDKGRGPDCPDTLLARPYQGVANHLLSTNVAAMGPAFAVAGQRPQGQGRCWCAKT